jgi:geranylgeranyl pyrophosphate synthase
MEEYSSDLDAFFKSTTYDLDKKIVTTISDKKIVALLKGGKRLRPMLAHLSFKVCTKGKENHSEYQKALEGAISIELAHSASLVHDDIIDRDMERRGEPAFHVKEGVAKAILTGHKMLAVGFNIALSHGKDVAKLYVDSWNDVVNGELNEVGFNKNEIKNSKEIFTKSKIFDTYNKIIEQKTAALFSSACKAGAIEANMSGDILKVFADYGREIGLAYQLADDLVDLAKGEIIDSVVIPLLNRLENKTITNSWKVKDIRKKFAEHAPEIRELFIEEIKKHVRKAQELSKSESIPSSNYKCLLTNAPTYIVNKMLREINVTI